MKRYQFILLALAACIASFSYGYSIAPECKAIKTVVYVPVWKALPAGHGVKAVKMSELLRGVK